MTPHYSPAWLDRPRFSASTLKRKTMSLLSKLTSKKPAAVDSHAARLNAITALGAALDSAIDSAAVAGVPFAVIIDALESREANARRTMAVSLRF
jgi:hypothetical protein